MYPKRFFVIIVSLFLMSGVSETMATERPNIILMLADDL
jgi:hypothetical protein